MTLNGTVKPGGASGTIIVKNGNAGKNGRVVLGAANTWDGIYQVTDHAALELAHAGALNTKAGVELQGAASRLDVKAGTVSYAASVKLAGAGASVNTLNSSSLSDISGGGDGPHRGRLLHGGAGFSRFFRPERESCREQAPRPRALLQRRQRERQDGSGAGPYGILRLRAGGGRRAGGPRDGHAHSCGGFRHQAGRVFLPGRHWRFHNGFRAEA